jgi:hypothetical protein
MSIPLPFSNNAIQVFAYEPFSYVISNPNVGVYTLQNVSNSSGFGANPSPIYFTKNGNSNITFAISAALNNLTAGTTEAFNVTVTDGSFSLVSSNTVTIGAGRFLDGSGLTLSNSFFTFFKNEPITPIRLIAPSFTLAVPISIPALPPGLSFSSNASNEYRIVGTPLLPITSANYQIIGVQSGGSKIVTTRFNIVVSNERLRVNLTGAPIIGNMNIGTAITSRVITSIPPAATGGQVRYTFPVLPDGIVAKDSGGGVQSSGFTPSDASYTMIIEGTPTLAAANAFKDAGADSNGLPYTVTATRFSPLPALSNTVPLTFQFAPAVLFDTPTLTSNYAGVPIDPSANFFVANTYFISNSATSNITNIVSPDLRSDLSLVYVPGSSIARLSGTPITAGNTPFTIRATNATGLQREFTVPFIVSNDVVSFEDPTPAVDTSYAFILSRPLTLFKDGFYTSNIRFNARAASGRSVVLTAPALTGTGLSLDTSGTMVGVPSQVTPLTTLAVTASAVGSPATATQNIRFSILNDTFTFTDVCANRLNFVENFPIVPVQFPVTTLSERTIIGYSVSGFPNGLLIDPAGLVTGTPTSSSPTAGNVTVTATTGYASGSRDFSYNITPESILFTFPQSVYSYEAGDPVSIQVTGTAYSGGTVGNYALTLPSSYGLTIGPTSGLISGTWTNSIPPNQLLFADQSFNVTAQVNGVSGASLVDVSAGPIIQNTSFVWASSSFFSSNPTTSWVVNSNVVGVGAASPFDIVIKNNRVDGNFIFATAGEAIYRSTNANDFTQIAMSNFVPGQIVSSIAFKPGTTTWWASGQVGNTIYPNIIESDDNGLTWYPKSDIFTTDAGGQRVLARRAGPGYVLNTYLYPGTALKYNDGVLLAGGYGGATAVSMLRSIDDGSTWNTVTGAFGSELAYFNLDVSGMWIATGSDSNSTVLSGIQGQPRIVGRSIVYSGNQGQTWSNTTGDFNMFAYEVVYANNVWVASGIEYPNTPEVYHLSLKYSENGINWSPVPGIPPIVFQTPLIQPNNEYTLRVYTDGSSTIVNQRGGNPASVYSVENTLYDTPGLNSIPSLIMRYNNSGVWYDGAAIQAFVGANQFNVIEMWILSENTLAAYTPPPTTDEYLLQFPFIANSFIYANRAANTGTVGSAFSTSTIYVDGIQVSGPGAFNPNFNFLHSVAWNPAAPRFTQILIVSPAYLGTDPIMFSFLDTSSFTLSKTFIGRVAEICMYNAPGMDVNAVRRIYNSKASAYGKPYATVLSFPTVPIAPLPMGSMNYDGSNWNVFTQTQDSSGTWVTKLYSSPTIDAPSWDVSSSRFGLTLGSNGNFFRDSNRGIRSYTRGQFLRPSASRTIDITLTTNSDLGTGPSISPPSSSFLVYQYVTTSLQLSATGTGDVYIFISADDLPVGLVFNPLTNIISGKPAEQGRFTTTVYARDDNGISQVTYTFTVNTPRLIRKQDGAGAYTSLLKQYTEVLAAQSARDSRALPTQLVRLGEFMSPLPVAVTTNTFNTNCQNCFRDECPASNARVDANGAVSAICDFIDANSGEIIDAGNGERNICD